MIYILRHVTDGTAFYLSDNKSYILGRKESDFLIQNDASVSRKHARLTREGNKVTLKDEGSKYKTFRNNTAVEKLVEITLDPGDEIRFGEMTSTYIFERLPIVSTGTRLNSALKEQVRSDIQAVGGEYSDNWHDACTHLTVHEVTLTVKVLQALINGKPIVTPSYWKESLKNIKLGLALPDVKNYVPPMAEALLNRIQLNQELDRKRLFVGKMFIFFTEQHKKSFEDVIRKAGGVCYSWEKKPFSLEEVLNSPKEVLIVQTPDRYEDPTLNDLIGILKEKGKRLIPLQELALAVILGSCEKNCNSSYDRSADVFKTGGNKLQTQHTLVANTQSEIFSIGSYQSQERGIIPDTFENTVLPAKVSNIKDVIDIATTDSSIEKRNRNKRHYPKTKPEIDNIEKKMKTENNSGERGVKLIKEDSPFKPSTSKRKAADEQHETPYDNPFAALKKCRSEDVKTTSKPHNPFTAMLPKRDAALERRLTKDDRLEAADCFEKQTDGDCSMEKEMKVTVKSQDESVNSIMQEQVRHKNPEIDTRDKTADFYNSGWITKKSASLCATKIEPIDTEIESFIELFQGTILTDVLPNQSIRQKVMLDQTNHSLKTKNVKKFSKQCLVKKRGMQKTCFMIVDPDNTFDIVDTRKQFDDFDDEENEDKPQGIKRKAPRKFHF